MDGIASKNPFEGLDAAEDEDESSGSGEETAADQRARRAQVWGRRAGLGGSSVAGGRGRRSSFSPWGNAAGMAVLPWGLGWGVWSVEHRPWQGGPAIFNGLA